MTARPRALPRGLPAIVAMCGLISCLSCVAAPHVVKASEEVAPSPSPERSIATNRQWDVLTKVTDGDPGQRRALLEAGDALAAWEINVGGVAIDGPRLRALATAAPNGSMLRAVREGLRRPVDLDDFLLFLDDVLLAGRHGRRGELVWVTPGRARKAGIFLHPDDVFETDRPRLYGEPREGRTRTLSIEKPSPQVDLPPAADGDPLGPEWTMRFRNPADEPTRLDALTQETGSDSLSSRIGSLMRQLRGQGAEVYLNSTARSRERGYLMWGAFVLGRAASESELTAFVEMLEHRNAAWQLDVPVRWRHPDGWRATRNVAREMADTYEVVFATEQGARASNHYTGRAVDLVALGLPRVLVLVGEDGKGRRFDLSGPNEPRDLSLTPLLIDWIEAHFGLSKLRSDYPHWDDAMPESPAE
jgi:hypothetical protein